MRKYTITIRMAVLNLGKATCTHFSIARGFLDEFALKKIADRLQEPTWIGHVETELRNRLQATPQHDKIQTLEKQLKEIDGKIERLLDSIEEGQSFKLADRLGLTIE